MRRRRLLRECLAEIIPKRFRVLAASCCMVGEMQEKMHEIRQVVMFRIRRMECRERPADLCKLLIAQRRFPADKICQLDHLHFKGFFSEIRQRIIGCRARRRGIQKKRMRVMAVQSRDQGRRKTEHLPELKTGIFQFFTGRFGNEQCGGDHENGNVVGHDVINSETVEPQLRAP